MSVRFQDWRAVPVRGSNRTDLLWDIRGDLQGARLVIRRSTDGVRNIQTLHVLEPLLAGPGTWADLQALNQSLTTELRYQLVVQSGGQSWPSIWIGSGGTAEGAESSIETPEDPPEGACRPVTVRDCPPGGWSEPDRRKAGLAGAIARQEMIVARQNGLRLAILPPRDSRTAGKCVACQDPETGQKTRSHCLECYDTGRIGGYDSGWFTYGVPQDALKLRRRHHQAGGQTERWTHVFRIPGGPDILQHALVVDLSRDDRYVVEQIEPFRVQNHPAVLHAICQILPRDHVAYRIPLVAETT